MRGSVARANLLAAVDVAPTQLGGRGRRRALEYGVEVPACDDFCKSTMSARIIGTMGVEKGGNSAAYLVLYIPRISCGLALGGSIVGKFELSGWFLRHL